VSMISNNFYRTLHQSKPQAYEVCLTGWPGDYREEQKKSVIEKDICEATYVSACLINSHRTITSWQQ